VNTCLNDPSSNVTPIPSMATPNAGVKISDFDKGATRDGFARPTTAPSTIHTGNKFDAAFNTDSTVEYREDAFGLSAAPLLFFSCFCFPSDGRLVVVVVVVVVFIAGGASSSTTIVIDDELLALAVVGPSPFLFFRPRGGGGGDNNDTPPNDIVLLAFCIPSTTRPRLPSAKQPGATTMLVMMMSCIGDAIVVQQSHSTRLNFMDTKAKGSKNNKTRRKKEFLESQVFFRV